MPAHAEEIRVRVAPDVELRTLVWAPAGGPTPPAFLLVHGLASNALLWRGVADRLAAAGHRVVAVDQRGHGASDRGGDAVADLPTLVADLLAVRRALDLHPLVAVGQSWGGNVVLELARRTPDELVGAVGVDGGAIDLAARFPSWDACLEALTPPRTAGTPRDDLERRLRAHLAGWPEQGVTGQLANYAVRPDGTVAPHLAVEDHLAILRTLWEHRPTGYLPEVRIPVLLLPVAEPGGGAAHKRAAIEQASRLLRDVRVRWFEGRSHDVHAEAPDEVAAELLRSADDWLARAAGGAA